MGNLKSSYTIHSHVEINRTIHSHIEINHIKIVNCHVARQLSLIYIPTKKTNVQISYSAHMMY